jgi:hypothetical protein
VPVSLVARVPPLPVVAALPVVVVGAIVPVALVAGFTIKPVVVVAAAPVPVAAPAWIPARKRSVAIAHATRQAGSLSPGETAQGGGTPGNKPLCP